MPVGRVAGRPTHHAHRPLLQGVPAGGTSVLVVGHKGRRDPSLDVLHEDPKLLRGAVKRHCDRELRKRLPKGLWPKLRQSLRQAEREHIAEQKTRKVLNAFITVLNRARVLMRQGQWTRDQDFICMPLHDSDWVLPFGAKPRTLRHGNDDMPRPVSVPAVPSAPSSTGTASHAHTWLTDYDTARRVVVMQCTVCGRSTESKVGAEPPPRRDRPRPAALTKDPSPTPRAATQRWVLWVRQSIVGARDLSDPTIALLVLATARLSHFKKAIKENEGAASVGGVVAAAGDAVRKARKKLGIPSARAQRPASK